MRKLRCYNKISAFNILDFIGGSQWMTVKKMEGGEYTGKIYEGKVSDLLLKQDNVIARYNMIHSQLISINVEKPNNLIIGIEPLNK